MRATNRHIQSLRTLPGLQACLLAVMLLCTTTACTDWMYDDRSGCEHGLWLSFSYDYNLQHVDMIDQVGSVGVFVYDDQGAFVTSYIEPDIHRGTEPYRMYLDLPEGDYQFLAIAQQREFEDVAAGPGAKFQWLTPHVGDQMTDFNLTLRYTVVDEEYAIVENKGLPLDTIWHGFNASPVHVPADRYAETTLSLMRDTKSISIAMREIDEPAKMDVNNYDFYISHPDLIMNFNPQTYDLEAQEGQRRAIYTPYATWNTSDADIDADTRTDTGNLAPGRTAHADFMTSRIFVHDNIEDNARLTIRRRDTGKDIIVADLCNLIGQLRNYDETQRYTLQEFLDRGYDFRLTFFLQGDEWQYVDVSIGVLGWSKRIQNVSL